MNSDTGFDVLEKIGYPGAPTSVTISDKTKILGVRLIASEPS